MQNNQTTIRGFIAAIIVFVTWVILIATGTIIPPEVGTFLNLIAVAVVAIWVSPDSYKEITPALFTILTTILSFIFYLLSKAWGIIVPDIIQAACQSIGIFLFGLAAKDIQKILPQNNLTKV